MIERRAALYGTDNGTGSRTNLGTALKRAFALVHGAQAKPGPLVAGGESLDLVPIGGSSDCPVVGLLELDAPHVLCLALAAPKLDERMRDLVQAHVALTGEGVCVAVDTDAAPDLGPLGAELAALGAECLAIEAFPFFPTLQSIDGGQRSPVCERIIAQLAPRTSARLADPTLFTYVMLASRKWMRSPALDEWAGEDPPPPGKDVEVDRMLAVGTMNRGELVVGDAVTLLTTDGPVRAKILGIDHKSAPLERLKAGDIGSLTLDTEPNRKLPQKGVAVGGDGERPARSELAVSLVPLGGRPVPAKTAKIKVRWRGASTVAKVLVGKDGRASVTVKGALYARPGEMLPLMDGEWTVALARVLEQA